MSHNDKRFHFLKSFVHCSKGRSSPRLCPGSVHQPPSTASMLTGVAIACTSLI